MRLLYIDQYFSTRAGRSGTRGYEFARRFAAAGWRVTVITSASDYSHLATQRRFVERTRVEGIDVVSLRIGYAQRMSYVRRAVSFVLFMIASTVAGLVLGRHDAVFASSTPLSVGVTGALISMLRGIPFVFEVRDLWPRAPIEMGVIRGRAAIGVLTALERWIYRRAVLVNALSPGMREGIVDAGVDPARVAMIPNGCDLDLAPARVDRAGMRREFGFDGDAFVVIYAGTLGPANDVGDLLATARAARDADLSRVRFLIVGDGSEHAALEATVTREVLANVRFAGARTRRETARLIAASDLGVTCFAPRPVLETNSPNKLFDYLACGVPQMVNTPGWMREIVEDGGAGVFVPHGKPEEAARTIANLANDPARTAAMRAAAVRIARESFSRERLAGAMMALLARASETPREAGAFSIRALWHRAAAIAGLALVSPLFIAIAVAIRLEDGGAVFYRPERVGHGGRRFRMWKFRTMVADAETRGLGLNVSANDERITRVGRLLRDGSLDELPQLFNVAAGSMRLVGPRPALPAHAERFDARESRRLRVPPGLTGLAQVRGRNDLPWAEKLEADVLYADNRGLGLDIRILGETIATVILRRGLYERDAGLSDPYNRELDAARDS
ncbi:sugar transferase [bacterium]|nr:sugar transferase [bacterium]